MAVSLPADIVMDVARAADPARFRVAVDRLGGGGYAAAARDVALAFSSADAGGVDAGEGASRAGGVRQPFDAERARLRLGGGDGFGGVGVGDGLLNADRLREGGPYEQFEALTLQKFVEAMLPRQGETLFGKGFAGETWKSFLAQQIAAELARSGGIGIASMIERAHPGDGRGGGRGQASAEALRSAGGVADKVAGWRAPATGGSV